MAKLDLDLISTNGNGRPVPKEMDRHIIKYIIGERKKAIEADPTLFETERWDHSDVFYASRTHLNQLGWDTSVYNDEIVGGANRRKVFYSMIKSVCEEYYHVKRHQIGIFPEDRAVMAFNGRVYSVGFDNLQTLMQYGNDVIVVEKQGTVIKMVPFTKNNGIAFIQSQGFVSEYGTALACLCNKQVDVARDYTSTSDGTYYTPMYKGHLGNLTDCDSSGIMIGLKIKNATRIGIDLNTIAEMIKVNSDLGVNLDLRLEDLQESTKINPHWTALNGIIHRTGNVYKDLSVQEREFYQEYLSEYSDLNGGNIRFIDYLKTNRIELNTILAAVKPLPFWNWLRWKILQLWPDRDYNRAITISNSLRTPIYYKFEKWYDNQTKPVIEKSVKESENELSNVHGFYEDVEGYRDSVDIITNVIESDITENVLLHNERIQEIDLGLESIIQQFANKDTGDEMDDEDEE